MLEEHVAYYLERYIGNYVKGLSKEALKISVWQGNVELTNMQLKPEALNALKLPIKVKAGFLGSVKLKVPWSRLGKEPVVVLLDRIFVLAEPATKVEGGSDDAAVQQAKNSKVKDAEVSMVEARREDRNKSEVDNSWMGSLISTIIGNLRLSITNIHIRYEDTESNFDHSFTAGLTLKKLAAVTVDDNGNETFVTGGALDRIQKAGELEGLSFYFNPDSKPWEPGKSWEEFLPTEWSKAFEPGIMTQVPENASDVGSFPHDFQYLLQPVHAIARYRRLGTGDARVTDKEAQKATLFLDDVTLSLSQAQYRDALKLVENFSAFNKRLQYAHYRPASAVKADVRSWWKYAYMVIADKQKKTSGYLSWQQIMRFTQLRKRYLSLYVNCLRSNPNLVSIDDNKEIQELDRELDVDIIIQWRMLAHMLVGYSRSQDGSQRQQSRSWWSFGWGNEPEKGEPRSLKDEDWAQLNQIIGYQEGMQSPLLPGEGPSNMLHTVLDVRMHYNATKLLDDNGLEIMKLSCENLNCGVKFYREMKIFDLILGSYRLSSSEGLLAESASNTNSISGTFTYKPLDKNVDWSLLLKASPCYVTYLKASVDRVIDFFQNSSAVSQTVALETAAAFQATLDEVARSAQQQLNEALKNRPRFFLDLDIAAPKIVIPSEFQPDGVHNSKLLLDLGYLTLRTEDGSRLESEEEIDLYMHFKFGLSELQVFLVDGEFDWNEYYNNEGSSKRFVLSDKSMFLPVLEKCGMIVAFQQICIPHPKYPSTRLAVRLPSLGFHFSPARYHRLVQIMKLFQSSSTNDVDKSIRPWDPADFEGEASLLSWKGIGNREAVWQHRYLALAGPFLYILDAPSSVSYKQRSSLIGKQVVVVPPESIGAVENVLAVCDAGQFDSKVVKSVNALVLRFDDDNARTNWQGRLQGAIYQYSATAAVAEIVEQQGSGNDPQGALKLAAGENDQFNLAEKESFFLTGALDELKIVVSSREGGDNNFSELLLARESPLLEFRALGSKVEFVMREYDMSIGAVLQALEVEDIPSSKASSSCHYLARSDITVTSNTSKKSRKKRVSSNGKDLDVKSRTDRHTVSMGKEGSSENFFDSLEDLSESDNSYQLGCSEELTRSMSEFEDAEDLGSDDSLNVKEPPSFKRIPQLLPELQKNEGENVQQSKNLENFVKAQVILFSQDSPVYRNVDNQIVLSLATLSFFCNRPTILALLDFVTAMTSELDSQEFPSSDKDALVTTIDPVAIMGNKSTGDGKAFVERKDSALKGLLGRGKNRTVFLLILNMDRALFVLNREDGARLATLSQEDLHTEIKVFPSSFGVKAALGNLRISDDSLYEGHRYNFICDMRNPGGTSFVELEFLSFNPDDSDYAGFEYSITGKLSEVRFIYLNRFIQEVSSYFMGLVPQDSGYVVKLKDRVTDVEKLFTQSEIEGAPGLKLDISLTKPIIIMPRATDSKDFLELDILHISVKNELQWIGGNKDELGAVRLDTITVQVEDVHMAVGVKGKAGEGIIQEAKGFLLVLRRPLRDIWHQVPSADASIKIEELKAAMSDKEYQVITECALSNISEVPNLPPPVFEHKPDGDKQGIEMEGENASVVATTSDDSKKEGSESSWTTIGVTVNISLVELNLFSGRSRDVALATLQVSGLWLAFKSNSLQESFIMATIDSFSVRDDREGTETELRYMIGKGDINYSNLDCRHAFSPTQDLGFETSERTGCWSPLTMLVVDVKLSQTLQTVSLRIQQPRLLVAVDFLLAIAEFFVPSLHSKVSDGKDADDNSLDMKDGIFLSQPVYKQNLREIQLTPTRPLIADNEAIDNYIYDGGDGLVHLLDRRGRYFDGSSSEPLVFVGNGKCLQFKNVVIQNGYFLDSCVLLGINSSYIALEDDGVFLQGCPQGITDESSEQDSSLGDANSEGEHLQGLDTPVAEIILDLQAIGPELTFYNSMRNCSKSRQASERLLRAKMDIFSRFVSKGDDIELNANINGLAVEASTGFNVLEPVDTTLKYSKVQGRQNIHVALSDIYTNFSFSILQLIILLQEDIMSFLRITTKQVTVECSQFDKIWTDDRKTEREHVTFWRPRTPPGFAVLGDCMTPSDEPPSQAVLALNLSYTNVKRPLSFELVWSSDHLQQSGKCEEDINVSFSNNNVPKGCSIWLPVAPPGYITFGCVASAGREPPPLSSAVCVLSELVTSSSMKDCITPRDSIRNEADVSWTFWRVDNSAGSFFVLSTSDSPLGKPHELRYVTMSQRPFPSGQTEHTQSIREATQIEHQTGNSLMQSEPETIRSQLAGTLSENVTCFELVWWNKNSDSRRKISVWRPILPPGCAFLGDIAVEGYEPPSFAVVMHNLHEGVLLKMPLSFEERGHIRKLKGAEGLFFWFPIAPPGYAALGCVASCNNRINPELYDSLRCVRNDRVTEAQFSSSLWDSTGVGYSGEVFSIWPLENEARTFIVRRGVKAPPKRLALKLADNSGTAEPDNLLVDGEVHKLTATFHDDFGGFMFPLLNVSLTGINLSLHGRMERLSSTVSFMLEMVTYNGKYSAWEPFIEPIEGFIRYENIGDPSNVPNATKSQVRIVSTSNLNFNLSTANMNMFLEASSSWGKLSKMKEKSKLIELDRRSTGKGGIPAIEVKRKKTLQVVHQNRLGQDLLLRTMTSSGQLTVLPLPTGEIVSVELPTSSSILDPSLKRNAQIRPIRLAALRIGDAHLHREVGIGGRQYMVAIRIFPQVPSSDQRCLQEQSARTRGVNPLSDSPPGKVFVHWDEIFVFEVEPGEANIAEMVVTDLTKGSSVGYCFVVLSEEEAKNNIQLMDSHPICTHQMKWQTMFQPQGQGSEGQNQEQYYGQISYTTYFPSITQDYNLYDPSKDHKFDLRPGTIQISQIDQDSWIDVHLDYTSGVASWNLGVDTIATEIITEDGHKRIVLRSLVMVSNATNVSVDVALCPKKSFLVGITPAVEVTDSDPSHGLTVVDEIFENERYQPVAGWGSSWPGHLLPSDPGHWSKRDGSSSTKDFPEAGLPLGWEWIDNWHVDKTGAADEDGWSYSFDFRTAKWPPEENSEGSLTFVRRRRWIRSRRCVSTDGTKLVTVGSLEPGDSLPLPSTCLRPSSPEYCLHIRPTVGKYGTETSYEWSHLVINKSRPEMIKKHQSLSQFSVRSLAETELLLCCTKAQESSSLDEKSMWFCLDTNANDIGKDGYLNPLRDWRIVIVAPLTLSNFLPVSSEYTVFEKCSGVGLIVRDRGIVGPGQEVQLLHADITKPVYLTWLPQGGWQPEHDAVLISHPYRQPASHINLQSSYTGRRLHVLIDYGQDGKDIITKKIRLYVPCWLDIRECPSLNCKFLEMKQRGKILSDAERKPSFPFIMSSKGEKVLEQINHEEINSSITMVSVFNLENMGLSVALTVHEKSFFGPVTPLLPVANMEGITELRAMDQEASNYHKLAASLRLCPYQSVPTKVVVIRPYMIFTNRLGQRLYIKQNSVDQPRALQPFDWKMSFPISLSDEPERLQIRTDEANWSLSVAIKQEETVYIAMRHDNGTREFVRMEVRGNEEGSRFLVVFRHGSFHGPYRFENHTKHRVIQFRQTGSDDNAWQFLPPHSTNRFAWEDPHGEQVLEVPIDSMDISACEKYDINKVGDHFQCNNGATFDIYVRVEEVGAIKVVKFLEHHKQEPHGREKESPSSIVESVIPVQTKQPSTVASSSHIDVIIDLGQVGLSLIDLKPQEILFLYMERIYLAYYSGYGGNTSRLKLVIGYWQLDNQLQLTCMPVLLAPENRGMFSRPVMKIRFTWAAENSEAIEVYPYVGIQVAQSPWRVNVHEPIIWAVMEFYNNLHLDRLSEGSDTVQADPEVRIDLIDVSEIRLKLTLETAPRQRPRGVLGIWSPLVTTLGNTYKMPIHIRSVSQRNHYMRKSAALPAILARLRRDLIHNPLLLLTGVDVLGMTSSTFATLSEGIAELSGDGKFLQLRSKQDRSRRIAGMSDGLLQGTEALAQGVVFGVSGVVTKPMALAKEHGAVGFLQGLGKAVLGIVVQPVSGALDFVALTVNGVGASCSRCFEMFQHESSFQRIRPALAIRADGILRPYNKRAAIGQAILQLAEARRHFRTGDIFKEPSKFAWSDFYVDHFDVPKNKFVMITSGRVMLLQCPLSRISDKLLEEPCSILWEVPWTKLLALEAAGETNDQSPSYVVLHLRDVPTTFAYIVKCFPRNFATGLSQAKLIQSAIQNAWKAYGPDHKTLLSQMSKRHQRKISPSPTSKRGMYSGHKNVEDAESSCRNNEASSGCSSFNMSANTGSRKGELKEEIFLFEEIWTSEQDVSVYCSFCTQTDSSAKEIVTIWHPLLPHGYVSLGDVARVGRHPPVFSVAYKNEGGKFATPTGFDLVWRNWKDGFMEPVSIWMPRAPDGYVAVGCVAVAAYIEPEVDSVWCIRTDLVEDANFEHEIWHAPKHTPWGCYLYQVASETLTFIAMRQLLQHTRWKAKRICLIPS